MRGPWITATMDDMADTRRRILITGATGGIGLLLTERLRDDYEIVQQGRTPANDEQAKVLRKADIDDYDDVRPLMDGIETVVHLAGAASPESTWDDVLSANIVGFRNVIEAARDAGVRRVVYASSNHAVGMYDRLEEWPVYPRDLPRPDSFYGVSKVFGEVLGEVLGRFYHDEFGIDFIALRIGWSVENPLESDEDIMRALWLSEDDTEQVFRRAIEAEARYGIYYAVSDNPNRRWDITNTMLDLGYRPKDSWTRLPGAVEKVVEGGAPVRDDWPEGS